MLTRMMTFVVGALVGAAVAMQAVVTLDRTLGDFFASMDESLATLEDM